jgi:pilus assembly protein Flp/PilA
MNNQISSKQKGQAKVEYALLLVLVALVAIISLALLGPQIGETYQEVKNSFFQDADTNVNPIFQTVDDFLKRIQDFYDQNGRWPRSLSPYNYTDLGLDPDDWDEPVEGVYWGPHGKDVGLANRHGDNLEIYVDDLEGNTLHLYNGWNIWCVASSGQCYYHSVAPGNEVDINTLVVVEE